MAEKRRGAPKFAKAAFQDSMVSIPHPFVHSGAEPDEILPGKGPPRPMPSWIEKAVQKASVSLQHPIGLPLQQSVLQLVQSCSEDKSKTRVTVEYEIRLSGHTACKLMQ